MTQLDLFAAPEPPRPQEPFLDLFFFGLTSVAHIGFYKVFEHEGSWAASYTRFDTEETSWRRKGYKTDSKAKSACEQHFKKRWKRP